MNFKNIISLSLFLFFIISCKSLIIIDEIEQINKVDNENIFDLDNKIDLTFYNIYKDGNYDFYRQDKLLNLIKQKEFKKIKTINFKSNYLKKNKSITSLFIKGQIIIFPHNLKVLYYDIDYLKIIKEINLELNLSEDFTYIISAAQINNFLFISYSDGTIISLNDKGKILWKQKFIDIVKTPIKIYNDNLILILSDKIILLNSLNGNIIWEFVYEGNNLLQSNGGDIAIFNNLIYAIFPNGQIGEVDTLFGEKNKSIYSDLDLNQSINNSNNKIHIFNNHLSYIDKNKYFTTIDIIKNDFIINKKIIKNLHSYKFFNNVLFVLDYEGYLNAYNILNKKLFWKINISENIKKNARLIRVSSNTKSLLFFFDKKNFLEIDSKNGNIINNFVLNENKLTNIKFYNHKIITINDHGKMNILSQ